jgi:hypothetical protein
MCMRRSDLLQCTMNVIAMNVVAQPHGTRYILRRYISLTPQLVVTPNTPSFANLYIHTRLSQ